MRLPRVRFTVRRMMVAVAAVAVATSLGISWQRRQHFLRITVGFALRESAVQGQVLSSSRSLPRSLQLHVYDGNGTTWTVRPSNATYYAMMREKYDRAARYPFLPVAPDPPEPQ
jgi:hypothetical protein